MVDLARPLQPSRRTQLGECAFCGSDLQLERTELGPSASNRPSSLHAFTKARRADSCNAGRRAASSDAAFADVA
ncbi:MAG: hypothetical protein IPF47_17880 [Gemmatimonadetes bacterium]|nr:hypothetical protein [Gemmatimonadota bacterium]